MVVVSNGGEDDKAAAARKLLEKWVSKAPVDAAEAGKGGQFNGIFVWRLRVLGIRAGRALCAFRVPRHLTDGDGNWRAGAIATLIDAIGAAAIVSSTGTLDVSVDFVVSYFSPAKAGEEVKIETTVLGQQGLLTCVEVAIRKEEDGELVALGKQWMSHRGSQSKL